MLNVALFIIGAFLVALALGGIERVWFAVRGAAIVAWDEFRAIVWGKPRAPLAWLRIVVLGGGLAFLALSLVTFGVAHASGSAAALIEAIKAFQHAHGLTVDGIFGPETFRTLYL